MGRDFIYAAREGRVDFIKKHIQEENNDIIEEALYEARKNKHTEIEKILSDTYTLNEKFISAARSGDLGVIKENLAKVSKKITDKAAKEAEYYAHEHIVDFLDIIFELGRDFKSAARNGNLAFIKEHFKEVLQEDIASALLIAVDYKKEEIISFFLENSANLNAKDTFDRTPLSLAVERRAISIVKKLLSAGADINYKDRFNKTIFNSVVEKGDIELLELLLSYPNIKINEEILTQVLLKATDSKNVNLVKLLLEKGCAPNCKNNYDETPLYIAVKKRNMPLIELLVEAGADITSEDRFHSSSIDKAVESEDIDMLKVLLSSRAEFNRANISKTLIVTMEEGKTELFNILLPYADINYKDNFGGPLLYFAIEQKNAEMVKKLIEQGADVNFEERRESVLTKAVDSGSIEIVKAILSAPDLNIGKKNEYGETALDIAKKRNTPQEIINLLSKALPQEEHKIEEPAIINQTENSPKEQEEKQSPAAQEITAPKVEDLPKPNLQTVPPVILHPVKAETPAQDNKPNQFLDENDDDLEKDLFKAVENGDINEAREALIEGADINFRGKGDITVLQIAVVNKDIEMAEFLMENGANVNDKDDTLSSVLHKAVAANSAEIVELLLDYGAVATIRDEMGKSVMELALEMDEKGIENKAVRDLIFWAEYDERDEKNKARARGEEVDTPKQEAPTPNQQFIEKAEASDIEYIKTNLPQIKPDIREIAFIRTPSVKISELLLACGLSVNSMESGDRLESVMHKSWSYSALALACKNNNADKAIWLIKHGADVNIPYIDKLYVAGMANIDDEDRFSPLMFAIEHQDRILFEELLKAGADINYQGHRGANNSINDKPETPLDTASLVKDKFFINSLKTAGAKPGKNI